MPSRARWSSSTSPPRRPNEGSALGITGVGGSGFEALTAPGNLIICRGLGILAYTEVPQADREGLDGVHLQDDVVRIDEVEAITESFLVADLIERSFLLERPPHRGAKNK